jgi:hypothetical protein
MRRDAARRPRRRLLWAVALGIVLAAGGAIIATSLSKSSGPPRSARLAASSPAVRPATSAATGAQSPQATASASATGSASSGPVAGSSPAAVVQAYFTAINNHDCATAWHLGGDNISAARGQSYQQFCQGFSTTSHDAVTVDSAAGNTVTVTVVAQQTDGSSRTFHGTYVVANGAIDSATVQASS